jgi:hypothetical protein
MPHSQRWNLNHKDREDHEEIFLCGLRGLCGSAVSAWLNEYKYPATTVVLRIGNERYKKTPANGYYRYKLMKRGNTVSHEPLSSLALFGY